MMTRVPLADRKDDLIEKWIRNVSGVGDGGGLRLPDLGKPAMVRRGKAKLGAVAGTSPYRRRVAAILTYYLMAGKGHGKLRSHLKYLQRAGAGERVVTPNLFDDRSDNVVGASATACWRDDRHHFRLILSPNDGADLDMKAFVRDYMAELEKELGTKLQWTAAIHEKADAAHAVNRHAHVIIRGIDDTGADLVMDREFIKHELRRIAEEVATRHLGQMSQRDLDAYAARQAARRERGERNRDDGLRRKGWEGRGMGEDGNRQGRGRTGGVEHG